MGVVVVMVRRGDGGLGRIRVLWRIGHDDGGGGEARGGARERGPGERVRGVRGR